MTVAPVDLICLLIRQVDPEKGKYFKILPNHIAPAGAKYSRRGVMMEREERKVGCFSFLTRERSRDGRCWMVSSFRESMCFW